MGIDLTAIIVAGLGGTSLGGVWLKHKYEMRKLTLEHERALSEAKQSINECDKSNFQSISECNRLHQEMLDTIKDLKRYESRTLRRQFENRLSTTKNNADIYRVINYLLHTFKFKRVYILQPHPKGLPEFLSVVFEVSQKGVASIVEPFFELKISEYEDAANKLRSQEFYEIPDVDKISDVDTKVLMKGEGINRVFTYRLLDINEKWSGTIVCECDCDNGDYDLTQIKEAIIKEGELIKNKIPEIL